MIHVRVLIATHKLGQRNKEQIETENLVVIKYRDFQATSKKIMTSSPTIFYPGSLHQLFGDRYD